jgi:hypothetical protein
MRTEDARPAKQNDACEMPAMRSTNGRTYVLTENASHSQGKFFRYLTRTRAYRIFDGLGWLRFARHGSAVT